MKKLILSLLVVGAAIFTVNAQRQDIRRGGGTSGGLTNYIPGTVVTNAALTTGDIYAVGTQPTNAVKATSANLQIALGNVYQASNSVLTSYSTIPTNSFVNKAGDIMSGTLSFSGTATLFNLPSLTTAQKNAATAVAGSQVYDSDLGRVQLYDGGVWHSRVRLDGDTMTGPLLVTAFTNSARTASTFVVANADKSDSSSAASSVLAATLTDETGTGLTVFDTSPTLKSNVVITNGSTGNTFSIQGNSANTWIFNVSSNGISVGGVTNSGQWVFNAGSAAAPSIIFQGSSTNNGFISTGANVGIVASGIEQMRVLNSSSQIQIRGAVGLGLTAASSDVYIMRKGANVIQIGLESASPANQLVMGTAGAGTDKPGGDFNLSGGNSTGTGRGGAVILLTGLSSTTGSTTNANSTRVYTSAKFVDLTESSATLVFNVTCATNKAVGGTIHYTLVADDGTEYQSTRGTVNFAAANKAGTVSVPAGNLTGDAEITGASSGTLTSTWTAVANGNGVDLKCNAVSSLSQTTLRVTWSVLMSGSDVATVTPQ